MDKQTNGQPTDFKRVYNSARQNQVLEKNFADQITGAVSSAAMAFGNSMNDAILTAIDNMDNVVILRVEMVVKLIIGSKRHGRNSEVQNFDPRGFLSNVRNTPLMSAASRLALDNELKRNGETCIIDEFKDGDFPAFRPNYDRRAHANHMVTGVGC